MNGKIPRASAWGSKGQAATRQLFDPEIAKWVIWTMVQEAGAEIWLNSYVTEILGSNGTVNGVALENLRERVEVFAPVIIDATGDGDIAAAAGAEYEFGSPEDGRCQPLSLYFTIANVDLDKTLAYAKECVGEFTEEYLNTLLQLKREHKPLTMFPFKEQDPRGPCEWRISHSVQPGKSKSRHSELHRSSDV